MPRFNVHRADYTYAPDEPERMIPAGFALWANTRKGTRPSGPAFPYSRPAVAIFPDSDKVGVWANGDEGGAVIAPRSTTVEYWHGEA